MGLDLYHVIPSKKTAATHEYFTIEDFRDAREFAERYKDLFIRIDANILGLFWTEKGYQRKGVTSGFYTAIENCKLYFDIATVRKVAGYIEPEFAESFQKNFIDNFVEETSVFFGSW